MSVGKEAEVADTDEAARESMKQEAAQELVDRQSHQPFLVAVSGISATKDDVIVGKSNEPVVGDRDAMGIVAEIAIQIKTKKTPARHLEEKRFIVPHDSGDPFT